MFLRIFGERRLGITKSVGCLDSLIGAMPDRSSGIKATDIPCARLAGGNPSARRFFYVQSGTPFIFRKCIGIMSRYGRNVAWNRGAGIVALKYLRNSRRELRGSAMFAPVTRLCHLKLSGSGYDNRFFFSISGFLPQLFFTGCRYEK